jgi:hypothetical protein
MSEQFKSLSQVHAERNAAIRERDEALERGEYLKGLHADVRRYAEKVEAERDQAIRERDEARAKLSAVERQRDALSASIKQTCGSDGSCENCGCVPSMQMPFQLCDECKDIGRDGRDALSAELEQARELLHHVFALAVAGVNGYGKRVYDNRSDELIVALLSKDAQTVDLAFLNPAPSEAQREDKQ